MDFVRAHILVCTGTGCSSSNSPKIIEAFERELKEQGMDREAKVVKTGCFGLCAMGPVVLIYPEGAFYTHVTPADVPEIVSEHIVKGRIVERLLHKEGENAERVTSLSETQFYKKQFRIALRNCGTCRATAKPSSLGIITSRISRSYTPSSAYMAPASPS